MISSTFGGASGAGWAVCEMGPGRNTPVARARLIATNGRLSRLRELFNQTPSHVVAGGSTPLRSSVEYNPAPFGSLRSRNRSDLLDEPARRAGSVTVVTNLPMQRPISHPTTPPITHAFSNLIVMSGDPPCRSAAAQPLAKTPTNPQTVASPAVNACNDYPSNDIKAPGFQRSRTKLPLHGAHAQSAVGPASRRRPSEPHDVAIWGCAVA
jgi:hypothetical protein